MIAVSTAIHSRFMMPRTKDSAIIAQQQPTQNKPWRAPMRKGPEGPPSQRARKKLSGLRQPGIPTITVPVGPFTGSPAITFQDRLDPTLLPVAFGFQILTATDTNGRMWRVFKEDTDGTVADVTLQLPNLSSVTGLATGNWTVRAESVLFVSTTFSAGDLILEELRRNEVTYARAISQVFVIQ